MLLNQNKPRKLSPGYYLRYARLLADSHDMGAVTKTLQFLNLSRCYLYALLQLVGSTFQLFDKVSRNINTRYVLSPARISAGIEVRLGDERVTVQNLRVVSTDADDGLIAVEGAVPGSRGSYVLLRDAIKKNAPDDLPFPAAIVGAGGVDPAAEEAPEETAAEEATAEEAPVEDAAETGDEAAEAPAGEDSADDTAKE